MQAAGGGALTWLMFGLDLEMGPCFPTFAWARFSPRWSGGKIFDFPSLGAGGWSAQPDS